MNKPSIEAIRARAAALNWPAVILGSRIIEGGAAAWCKALDEVRAGPSSLRQTRLRGMLYVLSGVEQSTQNGAGNHPAGRHSRGPLR